MSAGQLLSGLYPCSEWCGILDDPEDVYFERFQKNSCWFNNQKLFDIRSGVVISLTWREMYKIFCVNPLVRVSGFDNYLRQDR